MARAGADVAADPRPGAGIARGRLAIAGALARAGPSDIATMSPWRTLHGLGRATLRDPRLRQILDRYATYTGSDPRRAPAALATIPYVEQTFGIWHIGGGLGDAGARR